MSSPTHPGSLSIRVFEGYLQLINASQVQSSGRVVQEGVAGDMNLGGRGRRMSLAIAVNNTGNNMFVTETVLVTIRSASTLKLVAKLLTGG